MKQALLLWSALSCGSLLAATPVNMDVNGKVVIGESGPSMQLQIPQRDWGNSSSGNVDLEATGLPEGETRVYFFGSSGMTVGRFLPRSFI